MTKNRRKRLWVDARLQTALLLRVFSYWTMATLTIGMAFVLATLLSSPPAAFSTVLSRAAVQFGPALIAAFLLLPILLVDFLRMSHQVVGPIRRLRDEMEHLANGETVEPVAFRRKDFWADFAESFNRVAERLQQHERAASQPTASAPKKEEALAASTCVASTTNS